MKILLILSILVTLGSAEQTYNILGIFPHNLVSHQMMFDPIMKKLANKGHTVTVISYFPQEKPMKNYRDITLEDSSVELLNSIPLPSSNESSFNLYYEFYYMLELGQHFCEVGVKSATIRELLNSDERFDLVVTELFTNNCLFAFAHKFNAPVVGITSTFLHWDYNKIGNPSNPAYISDNLLTMGEHKTFMERLETTLLNLLHQTFYDYYINFKNQKVSAEVFGRDLPLLSDISQNISLILTNSHLSITPSISLVPGLIEIGGIHVGDVKKLPEDIEKWINQSDHGVIYFSMGSLIRVDTFPEEKREMFTNAFRRLPQRVLWKWENDTMPEKPENVMIQKWMPQLDVLCHPNVKVFITHGGMFGVTEAVYCGVPMVIIPLFSDQTTNALTVENNGGGVHLPYENLSEESIYDALISVLDPKFNKKAKALSDRFKDRPMPLLETAIYWIEYVARQGGAPHLKTAAIGMPFYKYLLLDVIAFLLLIVLSIIFVVYYLANPKL
ncbi:hypothetical protein RI129_007033 [Pyrocoelia pectoralis]|uniref:UDP-glucuronosyltransferase n=1 Tax=Pyrocoelia pectoralis TaxID=417401 RepID=A0AAN7VDA2_9COLE